MEDESVETIRETNRNLLILNRRTHRDDESDIRRQLADLKISSDSIADISNKLKTKSKITVSHLWTLKNGLMDDAKNIKIFLNTHGALRGLVRELSGHDDKKQLIAAGCCCNLALGEAKACTVIAKAAGPYLIATLNSFNKELTATCAWTVGNLCMGGVKSCEILVAQGALEKLCEMLHSRDELVWDAGVYALVRLTGQMGDRLSLEYMDKILKGLADHRNITVESSQLLFILSCHKDFPQSSVFEKELHHMIIQKTVEYAEKHLENCKTEEVCCGTKYLLRTLANVDAKLYPVIINQLLAQGMASLRRLLDVDALSESVMWLLGNLINGCPSGALLFHVDELDCM